MNPFRRKNGQAVLSPSVVLDTSGLIDGRIVQIAKAGFVPHNIVVPQFVIAELQFLADHGDSHKRERARYGLDVIRELQDIKRVDVEIARHKFDHIREVDDKLVALAKQMNAMLYTTDFNLNKVAQIEGLIVLNVNELAQALRPNLLPGERVTIKLTQVGQDKSQGVGYLGDGTMVVVEQASRLVGQQVQAICTRILQTQAGKMMFATLAPGTAPATYHAKQQPQRKEQPTQKPQEANAAAGQQRNRVQQQAPASQASAQPKVVPAAHSQQPNQQPAEKPQQRANNNRRRRSGGNQSQQARSAAKPVAQNPDAKKQTAAPATANVKPQRQQRRRVSPEDSLLATLKEIQK